MCGIAGMIDLRDRPIDPGAVLRMAALQAHRGPDGEGAVFLAPDGSARRFDRLEHGEVQREAQGSVGALAHRRLTIIDLSDRGAQPMSDEDGTCWLTYNGEIYNYVELREELEGLGHRFRSTSDTEVLLRAYREWGTGCLERLNGMFAFGLWDGAARRLFCARDRLGVKPFYYHHDDGRFLFASEPKAIVGVLTPKPGPNLAAMADYLCLSYVVSDETMFDGVHRLEPGCYLLVDADGLRQGTYWDPVFDPDGHRPETEWSDELRDLLRDSLRLQIRSDVPVGAHLSGGIDSSLVCSLAAGEVPRLQTFSARFTEGAAFDESPYARLVAERIGADHNELVPASSRLTDVLPRLIWHLDEPVEGPAVFGKYHVAERVSESVKVVLTGHGGDELFGGYDWYVKNLFTAASFGALGVLGNHSPLRFLWTALVRAEYPRRLARSLWRNRGDRNVGRIFFRNWSRVEPADAAKLLRAETLANGHGPRGRFDAAYRELDERRDGDRMFKFDMRHYLEALLTSEDRMSMAFSVESRLPLLDHRIAELAGRVGFEMKTVPDTTKPLLRSAARGVVPAEILDRRDKRGFPTPVERWFRDPELKPFDALVFDGNAFAKRHFDLDHVRRVLARPVSLGSAWSESLWRVLCLSVWGQVFELD